MARITYSGLVTEINGSIGGTTFQKNAYGFTVKNKPNMLRPWTDYQKEMQQYMSLAVKAWKSADDTTRNNWETWSSTNPQYSKHNPGSMLSGFACFVKWHVHEFLHAYTVDTAPLITIPAQPEVTIKLILATGVLSISIVCTGGVEDWNLDFYLTRPLGGAQNFLGTKSRFIIYGTDLTSSLDCTNSYIARFGSLPILGDRIGVQYVRFMESGGQVNSRVSQIITVTAS
jgi:hypothetical protein